MHYYNIALLNSPLEPFTYQSSNEIQIGARVSAQVQKRVVDGVVVSKSQKPEFATNEILEFSEFCYSSKQLELARFISSYYICSVGEALGLMMAYACGMHSHAELSSSQVSLGNSDISTHSQAEHGNEKEHENEAEVELGSKLDKTLIELSLKQQEALAFLKKHKVSLLFGDTGSGKTEIYMRYFQEMLQIGKRCIFLMPEISLTPQMGKRLKVHFGESVVMWHSKLTPLQKRKASKAIYSGEAKIIAGPRSALFLPIKDLGLIVVDEEHDDSYKSSSRPRYNARDIAIYMGQLYDASVVLGSATPSVGSYVKFPFFRLRGGYFNSCKEFVYERGVESLSPIVFDYLKKSVDKKEQAILFLPTRANFKYLICQDCGHTHKCAFCSVGMSIHQKTRSLRCHYCNFAQAIPNTCSECKSTNFISSRLGTAEAVNELQERFSEFKIGQFDRDVITTSKKLSSVLQSFNNREVDILVGTQMLSKGHDYHGVTLAVVLGLDNILNQSDYRAREKALSTLIQVAGRSGRKESSKVLVQTFNKDFFSAYVDRYEDFLEDEKGFREELYPPYKKLCRILFSHKNGIKAQNAMNEMQERLRSFTNVEIVGYKKCAIERVADKYRFEILLRADKSTDIIKAVLACRNSLAEIDMDPIEFG